ncbi:MAG: mechanosensitive ion channel protein MscS [Deltaproteobacteria bacterium HGW-Deltaproteobacteria-21]|nr:MAG: mechanosensitive ion channel protein MscS [Deltaproteobacteria bacterium HGW-Deltaproteobacteria-21]
MKEEIAMAQKTFDVVIDFFVRYSFQVIGAIAVLIVGWIVARLAAGFLLELLEKRKVDVTLSKFAVSTVKLIIIGFAVLVSLNNFGVTIAPFIAALAAMAFGASFAIQGPIANYGAGLVIILTRPFKVGNTVTAAGVSGVVEEIKLGATILSDEDGVRITIPNKHIVGEILHNSDKQRIVEEVVGISYHCEPEHAIKIIRETLLEIEQVFKEPPPQVGIQKFGDWSIDVGFRYWVASRKYFQTLYEVNLAVYKNLKQGGVEIPFPQREVRVISETAETRSIKAA